ncbi:hypothetical protein CALVIDRAFT_594177 [Calocera viscosa TUFC12733]|uniref:Cryptic loci regulator 2 N-terminal domain-containing protein n=1 Tax=Calocera viscosa (strain TUFC12733) TaxID=1330018 RepID=A0A167S0J4_CALVF|nr:hypothetical protein CALVIDRAFT_594177 [Calocera viscosa TUFC12733]
MSTSRPPFDPPMNGILRFPRSDGSPHSRPTYTKENAPPGVLNYMEVVPHSDRRNKDWRNKVGTFLMKLLPITAFARIQYTIADFPQHYALYSKPRLSGATEQRDDLYLYGSRYVNNFRSPAEFAFHAYWLMMDPTLDQANCECQWCTGTPQKELSRRLGTNVDHYSSGTSKPKSQYDASAFGANGRYTPPASPVDDPVKDAQSTLREKPPFRAGELVWANLRPPIRGESDDQTISCWPAIVLDVLVRNLRTDAGLDRQPALKLRLLGASYAAQVEAFDVLPYHAFAVPPGLQGFMANSRPENVFDDLAFDRLSEIQLFPDTQFDPRPRQVTFDRAWPAFCKGIIMMWRVCDRWSLTRTTISAVGGTPPPSKWPHLGTGSAVASDTQSQVASDAVWWGAEQIWLGDLVRLRSKSIQDCPILPLVSKDAETRCLFLKITSLQARRANNLSEVWLSGTLYEIVPEGEEDESDHDDQTKTESGSGLDGMSLSGLVALPSLPVPPLGFRFRAVLSATNTIFVPLTSVAGRYYPHLAFSPVFSAARSINPVRSEQILSLCGYAPGDVWPVKPPSAYQDRKQMWDGLEVELRKFLMLRWKSGSQPLKPEQRA